MFLAFLLSIAAANAPGVEVGGGGGSGGYSQIAKLMADDAAADDNLGYFVAIDGDFVVAGAREHYWGLNPENGSAYVFRTTDGGQTYGQVVKLMPSDSEGGDKFGEIVGIDGDTIVVSAGYKDGGDECYQYGYQETGADCEQGAVYIFRTSNGWGTYTETKLTAADGAAEDNFGRSVAIEAIRSWSGPKAWTTPAYPRARSTSLPRAMVGTPTRRTS